MTDDHDADSRDAAALRLGGQAFGASPDEVATTVVVDLGRPPYDAPPVLELRGPLTAGRVAAVLERAAVVSSAERTGAGRWGHRLERLGPGHHLLHLAGTADGRTFPAGLVADLLTSRDASGVPLGPAQLALLRRREAAPERHPVVLIDAPEPLDPAQVDSALRTLVGAHPLLGARIGTGAGGRIHAVPSVYAAECTVADVGPAREAAAVAEASRRLDPVTGRTLGAVLLRKRRRLALVAHELVADAASTGILRTRLRALLLEGDEDPGAEGARYTDWVASLPAVAADPTTTDRWRAVADGRAAASAFRLHGPLPDAAPTRHPGFVLRKAATARLTEVLPGRFGLTSVQLLTGAVGLALARWRGTGCASFDVHTDGRQASPALARTVGPLAETEPVLLMDAAPGGGAEGFVDRAARRLAVVGRASFAACREHAPDPALRLVLRELVPVLARFTPAASSPGPPRCVDPYALDITARVGPDGRLRVGLDWLPAPREGVTEESADHLLDVLREVLEELAQSVGGPAAATRRTAPSRTVAATPLQRELLADADAHPGTGRQIEQLSWTWHGPLDPVRFTAAWQSVFDHEAVLRSSFDAGAEARVVIHDRVVPEVVRLSPGASSLADVLTGDRRRGLDPRSPGPLRVTLLDGPPSGAPDDGPVAPTRVLLTYHHALLDTWSVRVLLEEFYRAYVAGGTLPGGGDRRPDLRDHAQWLAGQDLTAARDFWLSVAPVPGAASFMTSDEPTSAVADGLGTGRARLRLSTAEADRLRTWAARWGATESEALQAVWALLLYRTAGVAGPTPVRFSVAVTGRGIPLDGVERLPGALCNPVPVSVEVDPRATVPELLARLRDRAIDLAAYEWVSAGQIRGWTNAWAGLGAGAGAGDGAGQAASSARTSDSLLVFESRRPSRAGLEPSLAALGVRMERPETTGAATAFPVTLVAHDDEGGGLVLTVDHDRARLADATGVLARCVRLLRALPDRADDVTTVARLLDALPGATDPEAAFVTLRPGTGGVVCLVPSPDTPHSWYARLARLYAGPEALILLLPTPDGPRAWFEALRPVVAEARLPALGAFSGGGAGAYELARLAAAAGARPPVVVLAVGGGSDESVGELALLLGRAAARHADGP